MHYEFQNQAENTVTKPTYFLKPKFNKGIKITLTKPKQFFTQEKE